MLSCTGAQSFDERSRVIFPRIIGRINMGDVERSGPGRLVDRVFGDPGAILHNLGHVRIFACYEFLTLGSRRGRTHAKAQKPDLRAHVQSNFAARGWPPGTEFLDAETARQKSSPKCAHVHRDQNPGIDWPKIPAETPYLASYRKRAVCGDWMVETEGTKLPTPHAVTRTSLWHRSQERKFSMQRRERKIGRCAS